jgi:hypothetical protein
MEEDDTPSPLSDIPEEIDSMSPVLEELSNRELRDGAEGLEELQSAIDTLSRVSTEDGSFADILQDDLHQRAADLARYSERLAEHRERLERIASSTENVDVESVPSDLPEEVPGRATLTTKTINDNDYYYWQWREGDKIQSKYIKPVNPSQ